MSQTVKSCPVLERSALIVATLSSFMGPFMISAVNVALPAIQQDFKMDAVQLSWISTAYLLAVAVGLDHRNGVAATHGWTESSGVQVDDLLSQFPTASAFVITDISRDGMLTGPDIEGLARAVSLTRFSLFGAATLQNPRPSEKASTLVLFG